MPSIINSDDGVVSGTSGLKTTGGNDGILSIQNNGTTNVTVTAAGNVGIGTSSPSANTRLDVVSASNAQQYIDVLKLKTSVNGDFHPSLLLENNRNLISNAVKIAMDSSTTAGSGEFRFFTKDSGGTFGLQMRLLNNGDFHFNSGYGSTAIAYGCRAWVDFNGQGTVAIRASGNVSSITDHNTGDYTVNFNTTLPDQNFALAGSAGSKDFDGVDNGVVCLATRSSSTVRIYTRNVQASGGTTDYDAVNVVIFR